jgi:glycosyltransferase involved in cell wall biosynthesis
VGAPRKILFVIDGLARGGTELQLTGLIDRLDRGRWAPHLCTLRPSDPQLTPADCPHLAWDVPRLVAPGGLAAVRRLARLLRRERFAVVQTYFQDATALGGLAARLAGTPVRLASFRDLGFWRTRGQELMLRRVYPMMTGYVANSGVVRDHFVNRDGLDAAQVRVIPNGVDLERLPWTGHDGPTLDVGIVGNLNRRVKRTDLFLRAAGLVAREHPSVTWHVVGDGEFRSEYEALARAVGLGERVVFAGSVADVPAYLGRLQVGVLCSDSEGFSNALLEYMLCGCVPVATRVGGNPEAVADGVTGLLVPPDDVDALAGALGRLVGDVALRRHLAAAARQDAAARFSWQKCVAAHEAVYAGDV